MREDEHEALAAKLQRRDEQDRKRRELDIQNVMNSREGRRLFMWLMDSVAGVFGPSFVCGEAPSQTAYNEGRRSVGLDIMLQLQKASPDDYVLMLSEQMEARRIAEMEERKG